MSDEKQIEIISSKDKERKRKRQYYIQNRDKILKNLCEKNKAKRYCPLCCIEISKSSFYNHLKSWRHLAIEEKANKGIRIITPQNSVNFSSEQTANHSGNAPHVLERPPFLVLDEEPSVSLVFEELQP